MAAMEPQVECVPNFSTSDRASVDAIAAAISEVSGTWLLDQSSDIDHERSVITAAGFPGPMMRAMLAAARIAVERIDMRRQSGAHPRLGAIDVLPLVPLGSSTMADCVDAARRFAATISEELELPVYLYAEAALRPERRVLADIRRPGFEGLAEAMATPENGPDFGPRQPHPTAGAVAVGARSFLIAYNIQLSTTDVAVASRIASGIRERDGGLPGVQALGIDLASQGCAQLSLNILDHVRTPLWRVWEEAGHLASLERVSVLDSELIGLVPAMALTEVADHIGVASGRPIEERLGEAAAWLRIRRFEPSMALELRLADARKAS